MSGGRFRGAVAGALALLAVGTVTGSAWVLVLAAVPLGFVVFGAASGVPDPELSVERRIRPEEPIPGDPVSVTLTIENQSASPLPDVRVFDGVPDAVDVTDGSPTVATAIPPQGSATIEYEATVARGEHGFEAPLLRLRGTAGDGFRDRRPAVEGDEHVAARVFVDAPPTARETATLVGTTTADAGGDGVEFHTTREYRPGDPINRIDWRRLGRDGELSTIDYREQRGRSAVIVADCRPEASGNRAGDRCRYAADRMIQALHEVGCPVGLAALGAEDAPWVAPDGADGLARARIALRAVDGRATWNGPALRGAAGAAERSLPPALADRLPVGAEAIVVTPATDDLPRRLHDELSVRGHPVTVVSPDLAPVGSLGERLVAAERRAQIERLRSRDVPIVDWAAGDPLPVALANAEVRAGP